MPANDYKSCVVEPRSLGIEQLIYDGGLANWVAMCEHVVETTDSGVAFERSLLTLLRHRGKYFDWDNAHLLHAGAPQVPNIKSIQPPANTTLPERSFGKGQLVELAEKTLFRSPNPNFPLVDGFFYVEPRGKDQVATLLCLQMTFAQRHPPTSSTLSSFLDEFSKEQSPLVTDARNPTETRAWIERDTAGPLRLKLRLSKTKTVPLAVVVAYLTRTENFAKQKMPAAAPPRDEEAIWNQFAQYRVDVNKFLGRQERPVGPRGSGS